MNIENLIGQIIGNLDLKQLTSLSFESEKDFSQILMSLLQESESDKLNFLANENILTNLLQESDKEDLLNNNYVLANLLKCGDREKLGLLFNQCDEQNKILLMNESLSDNESQCRDLNQILTEVVKKIILKSPEMTNISEEKTENKESLDSLEHVSENMKNKDCHDEINVPQVFIVGLPFTDNNPKNIDIKDFWLKEDLRNGGKGWLEKTDLVIKKSKMDDVYAEIDFNKEVVLPNKNALDRIMSDCNEEREMIFPDMRSKNTVENKDFNTKEAVKNFEKTVLETITEIKSETSSKAGYDGLPKEKENDKGNIGNMEFVKIVNDVEKGNKISKLEFKNIEEKNFSGNLDLKFEEKIFIKRETPTSLSILIETKEIGKVKVSLSLNDGFIKAEIYPNTEQARNFFRENMDKIFSALSGDGLNLGQFTLKDNEKKHDLPMPFSRKNNDLNETDIEKVSGVTKNKSNGLSIYA